MGRDSSVGIATRYELGGPRIESAPVQNEPGSHPASYTTGTGSFLRPEHGVNHSQPI